MPSHGPLFGLNFSPYTGGRAADRVCDGRAMTRGPYKEKFPDCRGASRSAPVKVEKGADVSERDIPFPDIMGKSCPKCLIKQL